MLKHWKVILLLAIPSIASFASMTVTGTINLIMVGHMGALVIAIVGVTNIIMYNVFAIFSGIGHTVNYLVAQSYGANDMKKGDKLSVGDVLLILPFSGIEHTVIKGETTQSIANHDKKSCNCFSGRLSFHS